MNTELNALLDIAYSHALASRHLEAIWDYQAALILDPENVNAHYNLHLVYRHTDQIQLAFQELKELERLSPNDDDIYAAKSYLYDVLALSKNALVLQELISQLPDDAKDHQVLLGLQAHQQEHFPQALANFENALREQPDLPYIQGYVGRTLIFLGRNAEARKALTTVASDKRVRSTELYNLAVAERNLRNYAAAVPALERAIQVDGTYYKAWTMLVSTEWRLGHWRSSWHHFRQAVKYSPEMQKHRQKTTT